MGDFLDMIEQTSPTTLTGCFHFINARNASLSVGTMTANGRNMGVVSIMDARMRQRWSP